MHSNLNESSRVHRVREIEQRRELLEDDKVLTFFKAIDPKVKTSTTTTTTTTTTTKSAIEQGEARSAVNDLSKHLNIMLNQQIEKMHCFENV